jgi:hypothetical protein
MLLIGMRRALRVAVVATLAMVGTAGAGRANLILNPGFELPAVGAGNSLTVPGGSGLIPNWTVLGVDVLVLSTTYAEPSNGVIFNAQGGSTQALDLTGSGNTGPTNGVEQAVATTVGQGYLLSFGVGRAQSNNGSSFYQNDAAVRLAINGTAVAVLVNTMTTSGGVNWFTFTWNFVATTTSTTIRFTNDTALNTSYAGLDNVSLVPVGVPIPEPGTVALAAIGLPLVVGLVRANRRRRPA